MILKSIDGSEFEVQILDYEFPQIETDEWDSNWLKVSLRAKTHTGEWSISAPCLDTYEAVELCNWLRMLVDRREAKTVLSFLEPELSFQVIETTGDSILLQVNSRDWSKASNRIAFMYRLERDQLCKATEKWCAEIRKFPTRVKRKLKP